MNSRYPSTGAATKARAHRFSLRCSREDLSDGGGSGPPPAEWLGAPSGRTGAWEVADVMVDSFVAGGGRAGSGIQVGPDPHRRSAVVLLGRHLSLCVGLIEQRLH